MSKKPYNLTEDQILSILRQRGVPWPGMEMEVFAQPPPQNSGNQPDLRIDLAWEGQTFTFVAEIKARSIPNIIESAIQQATSYSTADQYPMVIVPYLSEKWLTQLAERKVSGLDLSGNGIVIVSGELFLWRSGQRNQFPESSNTRFAYTGATSLVPRVFLSCPRYKSVTEIQDEIKRRGGSVAISTVSKALKRMEDDLLVRRSDDSIFLIQPDELLEKLRTDFRPPMPTTKIRVRVRKVLPDLFNCSNNQLTRPALVLSGASSQDSYVAGLRDDEAVAYCEDLQLVRDRAFEIMEETERFADLTIIETRDRTPFFDTNSDKNGIRRASALQTYLELSRGDKRDQEMANELRDQILNEVSSMQ